MNGENKEELEKNVEETANTVSQEVPKGEQEPKKEETVVDSEEYYDDIDYQKKRK